MHILHASLGYKPAYRLGGPIHSIAATAETLVRKGHRVTVFTTNGNADEDLDVPTDVPLDVNGVEVWYFRRTDPIKKYLPFLPYLSKSIGFLYAPRMKSELQRLLPEIDVIHTQLPFVYPTLLAARCASKHNIPYLYQQRGVFDPERLQFRSLKKQLYIRLFERPILQKASRLVSLTEAETASYRALGVQTPCTLMPNGVHVEEYWRRVPSQWEDKLPVKPNDLMILFLGRLHPLKGADRLIEAFLRIRDRFPRARLVCAGPDEFSIERQLRQRTGNPDPAASRVHFPGMVSGDFKKALLARADLFCLPSDAEGFSMAVLEAMASQTPVLLSHGCHFPEVQEAGAGIVTGKDVASIEKALLRILPDTATLQDMADNALQLVRRNYNWEPIVDKLIQTYRECIQEAQAKP